MRADGIVVAADIFDLPATPRQMMHKPVLSSQAFSSVQTRMLSTQISVTINTNEEFFNKSDACTYKKGWRGDPSIPSLCRSRALNTLTKDFPSLQNYKWVTRLSNHEVARTSPPVGMGDICSHCDL